MGSAELAQRLRPYSHNIKGVRDRISSAADPSMLDREQSDAIYVDQEYGHSWSFTPREGAALYGLTDNFKPAPLDHLANGRFLRVPFRRIPVLEVGSLDELYAFASRIQSMDRTIIPMWRGQTNEYYVPRSEEESMRLFGASAVLEPSLPASASRLGLSFSKVFESWSPILDEYFRITTQSSLTTSQLNDVQNLRCSYNYRLWAFATAQHYGLPSIGLDVTSELAVALLFALHKFEVDKTTGITSISRVEASAEPVLYSLGAF